MTISTRIAFAALSLMGAAGLVAVSAPAVSVTHGAPVAVAAAAVPALNG